MSWWPLIITQSSVPASSWGYLTLKWCIQSCCESTKKQQPSKLFAAKNNKKYFIKMTAEKHTCYLKIQVPTLERVCCLRTSMWPMTHASERPFNNIYRAHKPWLLGNTQHKQIVKTRTERLKNVPEVAGRQLYSCFISSSSPPRLAPLILLAADAGLYAASEESLSRILVIRPVIQHIHSSLSPFFSPSRL